MMSIKRAHWVVGLMAAGCLVFVTAVVYAGNPEKVSPTAPSMSAEKVWVQRRAMEKAVTDLDRALKAMEDVQEAVTEDNKKIALEELERVKEMLARARKPLVTALTRPKKVVNWQCPMMGTKLDPTKVPMQLTRQYKGKLVGFCCAQCPAAWDKLSDEQREAKLKAAKAKTPTSPPAAQ